MKNLKNVLTLVFLILVTYQINAQNVLNFKGHKNYVNLGNEYNFDADDAFTIEAWIRLDDQGNTSKTIMSKEDGSKGWRFLVTNNTQGGVLSFKLQNQSVGEVLFTKGLTNVRDDQWHHIAVSYNGSRSSNGVQLYVDGMPEIANLPATTIGNGASIANNSPACIGAIKSNIPINYFTGRIDELRIWTGVRSQALLNQYKDNELFCLPQENLLGYYTFNQGIAEGNNMGETNLIDHSGNNHNGTLMGFILDGFNSNWVGGQPVGLALTTDCDCVARDYCLAFGYNDDNVYINSVSTVKFDNLNTGPSGGYGDYRGKVVDFVAGGNDVLKVTRVLNNASVVTAAWVDWNQNGNFEVNERIMDNILTNNAVALSLFTVPNTALAGYTRMRVITDKNAALMNNPFIDPCDKLTEGEVEDYCVFVRRVTGGGAGTIGGINGVSAIPAPNPVYSGGRITTTTTSPIINAILVNPTTGQQQLPSVLSSQISATGSTTTQLGLPRNISAGLYNLVLLTQDGTSYSDNIRVR